MLAPKNSCLESIIAPLQSTDCQTSIAGHWPAELSSLDESGCLPALALGGSWSLLQYPILPAPLGSFRRHPTPPAIGSARLSPRVALFSIPIHNKLAPSPQQPPPVGAYRSTKMTALARRHPQELPRVGKTLSRCISELQWWVGPTAQRPAENNVRLPLELLRCRQCL